MTVGDLTLLSNLLKRFETACLDENGDVYPADKKLIQQVDRLIRREAAKTVKGAARAGR